MSKRLIEFYRTFWIKRESAGFVIQLPMIYKTEDEVKGAVNRFIAEQDELRGRSAK